MSSLWLYLTLLYAASFVQNSASSGSGVTLKCNETVEVEAGEMVTLNCTITYSGLDKPQDCECLSYSWNNIEIIPCRQDNGLDSVTYVSLTLSNVTKNGTYTATIKTDCGRATSSPIEVQVIQLGDGDRMEHSNNTHDGE
ncbi:hypothetical protein PFLUV_G00247450 [Perca fluviatilis]|uniref:Immunoglobulin domain-containing protein n=2 Tax=Perca fluviatilis TaxID=8168 RepID=A0A6A5DQ02_PERFL|nr:hypothetical protein PFLUV_G00247450 [Perca fluviatilis]